MERKKGLSHGSRCLWCVLNLGRLGVASSWIGAGYIWAYDATTQGQNNTSGCAKITTESVQGCYRSTTNSGSCQAGERAVPFIQALFRTIGKGLMIIVRWWRLLSSRPRPLPASAPADRTILEMSFSPPEPIMKAAQISTKGPSAPRCDYLSSWSR
jgi:hypothetical protein